MSKRYDVLDISRFMAAMLVLLYHFTFRGSMTAKYGYVKYDFLGEIFKYGYLGVQFFFIISGFVIFMSVQGKSSQQFFISRVVRLFPAYWFAVIFTSLVVFMAGSNNYEINIIQVMANLTMLQSFLGFPHVDGVYWTLTYELIFYFWIFSAIVFKKINNICIFLNTILIISTIKYFYDIPQIIKVVFLSEYGSFFVSGMLFFEISKKNFSKPVLFMMLWAFVLSGLQVVSQLENLNAAYPNSNFSGYIVTGLVSVFYLFFFFLTLGYFDRFKFSSAMLLGSLTYPMYLIHQNFGYALINLFAMDINKYLLLVSVVFIVLFISYLINIYIEMLFGSFLYGFLKRIQNFKKPKLE